MRKGESRYPEVIALRIEPELREALETWAATEDRSVASLVRIIIRQAIANREGKKGKGKG